MVRGAELTVGARRWLCGCVVLLSCGLTLAAEPLVADQPAVQNSVNACLALIPAPWPQSVLERRLHLRRLEASRESCITHASFLAALGALWLEDGDAEQALIWLERSLMLEPDALSAQVDHAIALAALGEPTALAELDRSWRTRTDVPRSLRQRVASALDPRIALRLPSARLGGARQPDRASHGEASIVVGYESNLAISPRLTELTLTPPNEEPITLPVNSTLRRGGAAKFDLAWQSAWERSPRQVVKGGLGLAARSAPGESDTDWYQLQGSAAVSQRWNGMTGTVQADLAWFGGRLTEPYALLRTRLLIEQALEDCTHGVLAVLDLRRQRETRTADSRTTMLAWHLQCRPQGWRQWQFGLVTRVGIDQPQRDGRPGGIQRSQGLLVRAGYRPTALFGVDVTVGALKLRDSEGYSEYLEKGAIRRLNQNHVSLELSHGLNWPAMPGAEAVLQVTRLVQGSNLPLFRHDSLSAYAGLRWPW